MFDSSILRRSGNGLRVLLALCLLIAGAILIYVGMFVVIQSSTAVQFDIAFFGICLWALGLGTAWLGVRCPSCKKRWIWDAMRWWGGYGRVIGLLVTTSCPRCGYPNNDGDGPPPDNRWRGP